MKSYDDLQRFKEKTQTNNIKFKDMSEQTLESDTTNWAIIKQLLNDNKADSALERGQSIEVIQPQPIQKDQFATPVSPHQAVKSFVAATTVNSQSGTLFDSIAATLKPAEVAPPPAPAAAPAPQVMEKPLAPSPLILPELAAAPLLQQTAAQLPKAAAQPTPAAVNPFTARAENAPRYKQLFNSRHNGPAAAVTKDALLKPLLEKIALCR